MNTKNLPDNIRAFLEDTKKLTKLHNISIKLGTGKYMRLADKNKVGGYFDDHTKVLAVATNLPIDKWLEVMVHETCHMDQWLESSKYWTPDLDDAILTFNRYITGKNEPSIVEATDIIVMMEADCERRAIKKIMDYELPICLAKYSKKANAYLLSHKAMIHYQSWYKIPPYRHGCIWGKLPDTLSAPYTYRNKHNRINPEFFRTCFE